MCLMGLLGCETVPRTPGEASWKTTPLHASPGPHPWLLSGPGLGGGGALSLQAGTLPSLVLCLGPFPLVCPPLLESQPQVQKTCHSTLLWGLRLLLTVSSENSNILQE